jgi:MFS family permease
VAYAALSFPAGILADKIGRKNVLVPGMLLFALIFVAFIFANSLVIVILLFICFGVYMAMTDGITRAIGSVMVSEDVRASALGVINLVTSITIFPANFIAGFLWDLFGSWASFAFGAILAFVSAMIVWTSVKM